MPKIRATATGKCPNCLNSVRFEYVSFEVGSSAYSQASTIHIDAHGQGGKNVEHITLTTAGCPECGALIITIEPRNHGFGPSVLGTEYIVWPLVGARPVPEEVPEHIRADYSEAALVLNLSAKASAALSRRCLQAVLREAGGSEQHNLSAQIDEILPQVPTYIAESIDAIRNIGNFAAHPMKNTSSNQILEVEPGEAEWNLEVLDMLFDFFYVQPAITKQKRKALDDKLLSAGKPPMKTPPNGDED